MTVYRSTHAIPAVAGRAGIAAAGRVGIAISELPDSGLVHRLTRGRAWIAVLGALLTGIVALNVVSLSLTTSSGTVGAQIDQLERSNSALRSELAEKLSAPKIEAAAPTFGLTRPAADDITYIDFKPDDIGRALKVMLGEIVSAITPWSPPSSDETDASSADITAPVPETTATSADVSSPSGSSTPPTTSATAGAPDASSSSSSSSSSSGGVGTGL
jgi:hypothetical protein